MKRFAAAVLCSLIFLSACGEADETHLPEGYFERSESSAQNPAVVVPPAARSSAMTISSSSTQSGSSASATSSAVSYSYTADNVPDITQRLNVEGDKTELGLNNVYADGKLYTVTMTADKSAERESLTLTLSRDGRRRDTLNVDVPDGDRFVLLENADDNSTYGCEMISNLREFDAPEYPDIIGLVFRGSGGEAAVPEYARYFAVFGGRISELPVYENGAKAEPRGAKLKPKNAGVAEQHLTVLKSSGEGYEIIKFEYYFDLENKQLNKRQVKFYGWDRQLTADNN